jgi:outer membrane protein
MAGLPGLRRATARAAVLAACGLPVLSAQSTVPSALDIDQVIAATLKNNPDVRNARAAVDAERGARLQTARPFDVKPSATLTGSRTVKNANVDLTQGAQAYSAIGTQTQLDLSKMFRSGVTISSQVTATRTSPGSLNNPTLNYASASADLTIPLLQGRGGGIFSATERAAVLENSASERTLRATASSALLRATVAYWGYLAAHRRAEIQRRAASRARQSVEEVKILIDADERPRSDIDLMIGNAATKHAAEVEAETQIVEARGALVLAMGLDFDAAMASLAPATDFPDPDQTDRLPLEPLVAGALAHDDRLAAALAHVASARERRDGAASQLNPRVDLVVETGYSGQMSGGSLSRLFGAPFANVLGPNASLRLVFEPSTMNSSIRGTLLEAEAAYAQANVEWETQACTVRLHVGQALAELNSNRERLASVREAVARSRLALETVQRNFELGAATAFDRILAEDTVTNAELADLAANLQFATALASLQFARGLLVGGSGTDLVANPMRVRRASREDSQ